MWVWSLGQKDPPEKGMATHFSIPAWRIPWTEETCRLYYIQSMGSQRVGYNWASEHWWYCQYQDSRAVQGRHTEEHGQRLLISGLSARHVGSILAPWPWNKPAPPALAAQHLNHWTISKGPQEGIILDNLEDLFGPRQPNQSALRLLAFGGEVFGLAHHTEKPRVLFNTHQWFPTAA